MFNGNVAWLPSALATVIVAGKTFVLFGLRSLFTVLKSALSVNSSGVSAPNSARPSAAFFLSAIVASSGNGALASLGVFAGAGAAFRCCAEPATENAPESSTATMPYVPNLTPTFITAS